MVIVPARKSWTSYRLLDAGTPIGVNDAMIAAHARGLGCVLVTNNRKHFAKVSGLDVENWTE